MDVPGRWAGGFQAWDDDGVYLATGRGVEFGRLLQVPARRPAGADGGLAPAGACTWSAACSGRPGRSRRRCASASRWSPSARLSAGLAHELNNPAAAAVRTVESMGETLQRPAALARRARRGRDHRRPVPGARPRSAAQIGAAPPIRTPLQLSDAEDELGALAGGPRRRRRRGRWPRRSPPRTSPVAWCERRGRPAARGGPDRRPRVGRRHPVGQHAARRAARGDRPGLRARQRGALLHADGPRGPPAGRRRRGPREHRW